MPTNPHRRRDRSHTPPVTGDDVLAERTAEVLGDLERCMSHLHVRVAPSRLLEAAERIASHELGRREPDGWTSR